MFDNVATKPKRKAKAGVKVQSRTPRTVVKRPSGSDSGRDTAGQPFVNVIELDNTVPEGWRYKQVPTHG